MKDAQEDGRLNRREQSSSVVIRGMDATTFAQMEDFVNDLESRPLDRLLHDLPKLARLSATKFALVSYVIKGKFENASTADRDLMRERIGASAQTQDEEPRERLSRLLERLQA